MDDIPDFLEINGKKIPIDKDVLQKQEFEAAKRVLMFTQMESMKIQIDGQDVGIFRPKEILDADLETGTTIKIGKPGPKIKDEMIGLGGNYLNPYWLGANDVQEVLDAWNWVFTRDNFDKERFEMFVEAVYILDVIFSGTVKQTIFKIMSMVVDLKQIHEMGVNVDEKITEITSKLKGNMRSFNKNEKEQKGYALHIINLLTRELADFFAESRLARFSKAAGFDVKLSRSPDLLIDGVRVEAKFDRKDGMDEGGFANKIQKGFKQGGELVAIFTSLKEMHIKELKLTWFATALLKESLSVGLNTCKNGKKCILLYTSSDKGYFGRLAIVR